MILRENERGTADFGWLKAKYSFSFGQYQNPQWMGFESLRVMNNDIIASQSGFPMHPHQNMEIISLVLSGELTHTDDLGSKGILTPGKFQVMSAGSGITHAEFNYSKESCELLQIWIIPKTDNGKPTYADYDITQEVLVGEKGIVKINADVTISLLDLDGERELKGPFCLFVIEGSVTVGKEQLNHRDMICENVSSTVNGLGKVLLFEF